jgi:hypothetical protein
MMILRTNGESGIVSDEDEISDFNNVGLRIDAVAATEAVAVAEKKFRSVKERVRRTVNTLPFNLSNKIKDCLVIWAVSRINLAVTSNSSVQQKKFTIERSIHYEKENMGSVITCRYIATAPPIV